MCKSRLLLERSLHLENDYIITYSSLSYSDLETISPPCYIFKTQVVCKTPCNETMQTELSLQEPEMASKFQRDISTISITHVLQNREQLANMHYVNSHDLGASNGWQAASLKKKKKNQHSGPGS